MENLLLMTNDKGRLLHNQASLWDLFSTTFTYCYLKTQVPVINKSFTGTSLSLQCILPFILFFFFLNFLDSSTRNCKGDICFMFTYMLFGIYA